MDSVHCKSMFFTFSLWAQVWSQKMVDDAESGFDCKLVVLSAMNEVVDM